MKRESDKTQVSCRLTDAELHEREIRLLAKFKSAVVATEELGDGYAFRMPVDKEGIAVVMELIAAERECCPFLTFELAFEPNLGPAIVRVTGPAGSKDFLKTILFNPKGSSYHSGRAPVHSSTA